MWYEVIPSFAIVVGLLSIPNLANGSLNWLFRNRKTQCRDWESNRDDFLYYLRDRSITGSEYKPKGVAEIPSNIPLTVLHYVGGIFGPRIYSSS